MRNEDISMMNLCKFLTYEGDEVFGHDYRHPAPLTVGLPSESWEWQQYQYFLKSASLNVQRYYADCHKIPNDYLIVRKDAFTPETCREELMMIDLPNHCVAIPMKWVFRDKDMTLFEQWEVIKINRMDLPKRVRNAPSLMKALEKAYEVDFEDGFKDLFYDLQKENPEEFNRRKNYIDVRRNEIVKEVKQINKLIKDLRATRNNEWTDKYDWVFHEYELSPKSNWQDFGFYCENRDWADGDPWSIVGYLRKEGSVVWQLSKYTEKIIALSKESDELWSKGRFDVYSYTFMD